MDQIKNILSHFQKYKTNNNTPLTINEVTIQQITNNSEQVSETEHNNEEHLIEIEVPPLKKLKKNTIELKEGDMPENINISEATFFNDNHNTVFPDNKIIDLTDDVDVQNVLDVSENSNISDVRVSLDDNHIAVSANNNANNKMVDTTDNLEAQNVLEVCETAENSVFSDTVIPFNDDQTAVSASNNANNKIIDLTDNLEVKNEFEVSETAGDLSDAVKPFDDDQTAVFINSYANNTTISNTDKNNCNKPLNPQNNIDIVANISTENISDELSLEDILASVESELTLNSEITLVDVNDLINYVTFDSDNEFHIADTDSQTPTHIVTKPIEKLIPTDSYALTYDKNTKVEPVNPKPEEINNSNTERDAKINKTAKNNTLVTDANIDTNSNNGNTKPDVITNTNNGYTNASTANTNKIEDYDTISLSSDDNTNEIDPIYISDSSESDCGYHSSDFEFITEEEAKREGLIINYKPDNLKNIKNYVKPAIKRPKAKKVIKKANSVQARPSRCLKVKTNSKNDEAKPINPIVIPPNIQPGSSNTVPVPPNIQPGPSHPVAIPPNIQPEPNNPTPIPPNIQPGPSNTAPIPPNIQPGPSNPAPIPPNIQPGPSNPVSIPPNVQPNYESYRNKYKKQFNYDTSYRNNHIEPQGDGYMDLFRGFNASQYPMYARENKSLTPYFHNPSRTWYQGVGFDMQMMRGSSDDEEDEVKNEAKETLKKMRSEYPGNNRKRRHQ